MKVRIQPHYCATLLGIAALTLRNLANISVFLAYYSSVLGITGFFQADGCVTFIITTDLGPQANWSNYIQREHIGTAYAIVAAEYGGIRLLVAGEHQIFPMMCWPNIPSCEATFPIVPIPMVDKSPTLAMEMGLDEPDHLYIATLESFWILHLPTMRPLPGFFKWAGKPALRAYAMDSVQIVQTRFDLKGIRVLIVLAGALPLKGRIPYSQPGLIISLFVSPGGVQVMPVTDTLLDTSPMSFHQPSMFPGVYFWTQINNASTVAYLNSRGGAQDEPNTQIELKDGASLAPGFAELTDLSTGLVSTGLYNRSQVQYGLKLSYDPISGSGISVASTDSSATSMGRPLLFKQPNPKIPFVLSLVRTEAGPYAIETYNFDFVGPAPEAASSSPLQPSPSEAPYTANTQDNISSRASGNNFKPRNSSYKLKHAFDTRARDNGALPPNCMQSNCSFEENGDCPPDHCWVIGATAQFFCCLRPPI